MPEGQQYHPEVEKHFETSGENAGRLKNTAYAMEKAKGQDDYRDEMIADTSLTSAQADKYVDKEMNEEISGDMAVKAALPSLDAAVRYRDSVENSQRAFERGKEQADQAQTQVEGLQQTARAKALEYKSEQDQAEIARLRAQLAGDKAESTEQTEKPKNMTETTLDLIVQNRGIKYAQLRTQLSEKTGQPVDENELKNSIRDLLHHHQIASAGNERYQKGSEYKG